MVMACTTTAACASNKLSNNIVKVNWKAQHGLAKDEALANKVIKLMLHG
jgi:hypothetical protein